MYTVFCKQNSKYYSIWKGGLMEKIRRLLCCVLQHDREISEKSMTGGLGPNIGT